MKTYRIPSLLKTIIFDIDSTLYTNDDYAFEQVDCQVREYAKEMGISVEDARKKVADYRAEFARTHNGSKVSLGNTMLAFGVSIEHTIEWRKRLLKPSDYFSEDKKLVETLSKLAEQYSLVCVTNNPVLPARKTLEALGVSDFIPEIIGLDTCFKSKPAKEPFLLAAEKCKSRPEECLAVGDRFDIDIALPLDLGMGGILVSGVEEVYELPYVINCRNVI